MYSISRCLCARLSPAIASISFSELYIKMAQIYIYSPNIYCQQLCVTQASGPTPSFCLSVSYTQTCAQAHVLALLSASQFEMWTPSQSSGFDHPVIFSPLYQSWHIYSATCFTATSSRSCPHLLPSLLLLQSSHKVISQHLWVSQWARGKGIDGRGAGDGAEEIKIRACVRNPLVLEIHLQKLLTSPAFPHLYAQSLLPHIVSPLLSPLLPLPPRLPPSLPP